MPTRINNALRNEIINIVHQQLSHATLRIYTGPQPANADASPAGTLLLTFEGVEFNTPSNGQMTLDVTNYTYNAVSAGNGTAGWGRLSTSSGRIDGEVGTSGQQFNLTATSLSTGDPVMLQSCVINMPGG